MDFWGPDCAERAIDYLMSIETPLLIYAHNGGKFDFFFIYKHLQNPIRLIHGRIVSARLGIHEFRDSWSIIPMPLGAYQKEKIDYELFESDKREANKLPILRYLRSDCVYLHELCTAFVSRFGPRLTVAGTAIRQLKELHPQRKQSESHDEQFRPFYFGGRVDCFESGIIHGDWKVYDVNSMYPHVMREFKHPLGGKYATVHNAKLDSSGWIDRFPDCMYFCVVRGFNRGALPSRLVGYNGGLTFNEPYGEFFTTSHELRCAVSLGLFDVESVVVAYIPYLSQSFGAFVDKFSAEKIAAKVAGDKIGETFSKLILNSAYGRFGINPRDFKEWKLEILGLTDTGDLAGYQIHEATDEYRIWAKPSESVAFEDVAIAASITSAARSVLLQAIKNSVRPIYCDTDSIVCEALNGVALDTKRLGAWKLEAKGNKASIAGKKLYAIWDAAECVKYASKGVKISPSEIDKVAQGGVVTWQSDAPNFSLTGNARFVKRRAQSTIKGR